MNNLELLRPAVFALVVETGSFRGAANGSISPAYVSQLIVI